MAQMNRNVNLEEIDSDALFGIDAFKYQKPLQKVVFWGCLAAAVGLNVTLSVALHVPASVCVLLFLVLLLIGVAFGCNYAEDMTYGRYMMLLLFHPRKDLFYRSTEDIVVIREKAQELHRQDELTLRSAQKADPEAQKRLLRQLLVFGAIFVAAMIAVFVLLQTKKAGDLHHSVGFSIVTDSEDFNL